jgi:cbb3-type cytochrome oxidase subunit 3
VILIHPLSKPVYNGHMNTRLLNLALIALLTAYAAIGLSSRYEADDYCMAIGAYELGVIGTTVDQYNTWQGRYTWSMVTATVYNTLGRYAPAIMPALLTVFMVGGLLYLLRPVRREYALTMALVLTLGFITGLPNAWQSYYWMSAALNYMLPVIAFLYLVGWLLRRLRLPVVLQSLDSVNNGA